MHKEHKILPDLSDKHDETEPGDGNAGGAYRFGDITKRVYEYLQSDLFLSSIFVFVHAAVIPSLIRLFKHVVAEGRNHAHFFLFKIWNLFREELVILASVVLLKDVTLGWGVKSGNLLVEVRPSDFFPIYCYLGTFLEISFSE